MVDDIDNGVVKPVPLDNSIKKLEDLIGETNDV